MGKLSRKMGLSMFANSVKLFSLSGFDIKLDPSWVLIAALITWSLSQHYFPSTLPYHSAQAYLVMAVGAMLCFFASLLLHELAHSVVARRSGVPIKGITLFLFGGVAELEPEPQSPVVEFWVALAGPVMSFALAFGFWVLTQLSALLLTAPGLTEVLSYLAFINLVLALFNLVPAFPLDGGRVLRAYLWHRSGDALQATETASKTGAAFAYALMTLGVLSLFQGGLVAGLWYIMIGSFVLAAAKSSYENQLAHTVLKNKSVSAVMTRDPVTVEPAMTLADFANSILLGRRVSFAPVVEDGVLLGHMDQNLLAAIDRENWADTRVGDVFAGLDADAFVPPEMPAEDLLQHMSKTGRRKFLVVHEHHLDGVITLADLSQYLRTADALRPH